MFIHVHSFSWYSPGKIGIFRCLGFQRVTLAYVYHRLPHSLGKWERRVFDKSALGRVVVIKWRSGSFDSSYIWWSGVSCNRLALVWHLLKQTWYLDILITYCSKNNTQDPRSKITLPPTHSLQIGVREISICFHMEAKCFHVSAHVLKLLLMQIYTNMHIITIKASQRATHLTSKHRLLRLLGAFRFLHIPPCWDRKIPICWSSAGKWNGWSRQTGPFSDDEFTGQTYLGTLLISNQRSYGSFCTGMPRNAENPGINYSKL